MNRRALIVAAAAGLFLSAPALNADIVRESTGQRRVELDKMELQPFPAVWDKLTGWTGGDALTPASIEGKVVLVMSWSSWQPASLKALPLAQAMAAKHSGAGLIVVGVHHQQGWDDAANVAKSKGLTFRIAHDQASEFRKAAKIDHDPEFYIIDRAGHLRIAAISSQSVEEACDYFVKETKEEANDVPRILRARAEQANAEGRKTTEINTQIDLSTLPPVPPGYVQPSSAAYKVADWPRMDEESAKSFGLMDDKGKRLEPKVAFQPVGYFPARPETQGRAIVIYFWHPDINETYAKVMPRMDLLQQSNPRDLAVIGAMVPVLSLDPSRQNAQGQKEEETPEKLRKRYQSFVSSQTFRHALAADVAGTSISSLAGNGGGNSFPRPGAMVISSDGVIRWVGRSDSNDFKYAVDTVIAADPAVKARRIADRAYIEKK